MIWNDSVFEFLGMEDAGSPFLAALRVARMTFLGCSMWGFFGMIHGALLVALIYSVFSRLSLATKGILKLIKEFNFLEIPLACGVFIWCVGQSG